MKYNRMKFDLDKKENTKWRLKEGTKGIIKTTSGFVFMALPLPVVIKFVALPQVISGAVDVTHSVLNNYIKDSMINVGNDDIIKQNFSSPNTVLTCMLAPKKQKAAMLLMQEINFLLQAKKTRSVNGKEERIRYRTNSQKMTKKALELMEKNGYISELEIESAKKKNLVFEKISMGNISGITKKEDMYDMSFNITDKRIDEKAIKKLIHKSLDSKELIVKRDKDGNVQSINYRLSEIIKQRINRVLNRFRKNDKKLLISAEKVEQCKMSIENDSFREKLGEMVNDIKETSMYSNTQVERKEKVENKTEMDKNL